MTKPDQSIVYRRIGETELRLHVFYPEGEPMSNGRPAIVFFFGGGWVEGTPTQFYPHCRYLADRGMVAMAAEYRIWNLHQVTPFDCAEDARFAIRWCRAHADELGVDGSRVAAGGGSAGAHLAVSAAVCEKLIGEDEAGAESCRPDALVLFNPVLDTSPEGYGYDRIGDTWRTISPLHNLKDDTPPTTVFLGTNDDVVPVSTARRFQNALNSLGCRCDFHLYEGQTHGFFNYEYREYYVRTVVEMDKFLESCGYLEGAPTMKAPS